MRLLFQKIFLKILRDFVHIFSGRNLFWHLLAMMLTTILVLSGFDQGYYLATRSETMHILIFPAIVGGGLLPILIPIFLLVIGQIYQNRLLKITAGALAEAALLGSLTSSVYKTFTGRLQPDWTSAGIDLSHQFQFGFLRHGVFWGWPSSHTTIAFAMAFAFASLFPEKYFWKTIAILWAVYVGFSVSVSIHWFSDFLAGAIIGIVIGITVGRGFRSSLQNSNMYF